LEISLFSDSDKEQDGEVVPLPTPKDPTKGPRELKARSKYGMSTPTDEDLYQENRARTEERAHRLLTIDQMNFNYTIRTFSEGELSRMTLDQKICAAMKNFSKYPFYSK